MRDVAGHWTYSAKISMKQFLALWRLEYSTHSLALSTSSRCNALGTKDMKKPTKWNSQKNERAVGGDSRGGAGVHVVRH